MEYKIYKLSFPAGVHFGEGMLNDSSYTFSSDLLFSALFIEAIKLGTQDAFLDMAKKGKLKLSDAFPYVGEEYYVPKPVAYIERTDSGNSTIKKKMKKIGYINVNELDSYFEGTFSVENHKELNLGIFSQQIMASVRREEDTLPYYVGTYYYNDNCGLYIIAGCDNDEVRYLFEDLLDSLHYTGIGGKKSSGLGKFEFSYGKDTSMFDRYFTGKGSIRLLVNAALPKDEELEQALENASYTIKKRSGFVYSQEYKKKDLFVFGAGSCFENSFEGDVYDVSDGGAHPVYRYAKPMFLEV